MVRTVGCLPGPGRAAFARSVTPSLMRTGTLQLSISAAAAEATEPVTSAPATTAAAAAEATNRGRERSSRAGTCNIDEPLCHGTTTQRVFDDDWAVPAAASA